MMELSKEMNQRMAKAGGDVAWAEKFRTATTWDEYEKLLSEKGIEATAELKELFAAGRTSKTGELADDDLEKVSGGFDLFTCPKEPNVLLCAMTNCPHVHWAPILASERVNYCDLGYWREVL